MVHPPATAGGTDPIQERFLTFEASLQREVELVRVELDRFIVISNNECHMNHRLPHHVSTC